MGRLTEVFAILNCDKTPNADWIKANIKHLDIDVDKLKKLQKVRRENKK
jgi:hypothetical protein